MPHLFKSHLIDDDQYPMPQAPAQQHPASGANAAASAGMPAEMAAAQRFVDPAELQQTASELDHIIETVSRLRPAVDQLTDSLKHGAQQQGYAEGHAQAQAEMQQHMIDAATALTEAQDQRHALAEQNSAALADLAMRIARKVIGEQLAADPTLVARIVEQAILELEPSTTLQIHVHPVDEAAVAARSAVYERLVSGGTVEIVLDESVDQGGCILVSPVGEVDARISTKLSVIEAAFDAQRRAGA